MRQLVLMLLAFNLAAAAAAQEAPRHDWIRADLDIWFAFSLRERIWSDELQQGESAGVPFDFGDIGVDREAFVPNFTLGFHPTASDHLEFNTWLAVFSGKGTVDKAFAYDGNAFAAGDRVDSEFEVDQYRLTYRRDLFTEESIGIDLWLGLGGTLIHYDNSVQPVASAQTIEATENLDGIFTLGGLGAGKRFGDCLEVSLQAWFGLVGGSGRGTGTYFDQRYIDLMLQVNYQVTSYFDVLLGYKFFEFSLRNREHGKFVVNSENDLEQVRLGGPVLGIAFTY